MTTPTDLRSALIEALDEGSPSQALPRLVGADLRGADLTGRDLSGLDLSNADLRDAKLARADLTDTVLFGARLTGASLLSANLHGADLRNVDATGVSFAGATARAAQFEGATLDRASFTGVDLHGASLGAASLIETRLREADLTDVDALRANLAGADLEHCLVDNANFHDATLDGARVRGLQSASTANWIGATITNIDFTGAYLTRRIIIDQNYLHEFRSQSRHHEWIYRAWSVTSDCGRSFARWAAFNLMLAVGFALLYLAVDIDYGDHETIISPLYYSLVTMTTLGYGDVLPASGAAQVVAMAQVIAGYLLLGGLLGIFASKMSRRAD